MTPLARLGRTIARSRLATRRRARARDPKRRQSRRRATTTTTTEDPPASSPDRVTLELDETAWERVTDVLADMLYRDLTSKPA